MFFSWMKIGTQNMTLCVNQPPLIIVTHFDPYYGKELDTFSEPSIYLALSIPTPIISEIAFASTYCDIIITYKSISL